MCKHIGISAFFYVAQLNAYAKMYTRRKAPAYARASIIFLSVSEGNLESGLCCLLELLCVVQSLAELELD